ncbi:MAG: outer membrane beta-barrel protein [Desulfobacterales bacterium]|nr:outer membrane beta-barrel protein [Desulfobacterales bacterium]
MKRKTLSLFTAALSLAVIFLFSLSPLPAAAQGQMIIAPRVDAQWRWDDNFHRADTREKSVYTYSLKPGFTFGYTTDKTTLSLDYDANALRYDDRDSLLAGELSADDFDYVEHRADFSVESRITRRLLVGVDNLFWSTRDPANSDAASNAVDRYKYKLNRFSPRVVYNLGDKFGVGLSYVNQITDYTDDAPGKGEDSEENRGSLNLFYYLNSRTSVDLDIQAWNRDYHRASVDYDSRQFMVNLNKQFNFLTFSLGAGYQNREFDQTLPGGDLDTVAWRFAVAGQNPADAVGYPKTSIYFAVGKNLNDAGSGNTYYEATRVDAALSRLFFEKVNLTLAGWYQNADYETSAREDDRWNASLAVDHLINDALSWGMEGGMEDRDSNEDGYDFTNTYFMVNVKFNYDMGAR